MKFIKSKDNENIKHLLKLKDKKYIKLSGQFMVEGLRFIEEALNSDYVVDSIYICEDNYHKFSNIDFGSVDVSILPKKLFLEVCDTVNSQGILGVLNKKESNKAIKNGFYVLCDKIQDPGNLGTIIRTVHGTCGNGVIVTKGTVDLYSQKVLRSSMGSIFYIDLIEDYDLSFVNNLKKNGFLLVGSSLNSNNNLFETSFKENVVLVIGNEGNGVSNEVMDICDINVKIPMAKNIESLNAAVSAGIMMYEIARQKKLF